MNTPQKFSAKEYLSRAYLVNQSISVNLEQARSLRELAEKTSVVLSGMPPGATRNFKRLDSIMAAMADLERLIDLDINKLINIKREIIMTLGLMSNPTHRALLELRYLCFKRWDAIAADMHYSLRNCYRIHKTALREMDAILLKIKTRH
jgi:hypothetical protein